MNISVVLLMICLRILSERRKKEFNFNFHQNDFMVEAKYVELVRYDKRYVNHVTVRSFKFNRTTVAHNVTFSYKIDVGNDLEVVSQSYRFASNEYRLFPIRVGVKVCKGMVANIMGFGSVTKCGNFTGCSFMKNKIYHLCNFAVNPEKLPPYIPAGEYMLEMTFSYLDKELYVTHGYGRVYRNILVYENK